MCLAVAVALGWRAWSARIELGTKSLRVHNTLATTTVDRREVRRVSSAAASSGAAGVTSGAAAVGGAARGVVDLRDGRTAYALNRERLESWTRLTARLDLDPEAA